MADADLVRALAARNRAGDLDAIPVEQEDTRPFLQRLKDALASGGWQDPVPGQRGTFVPGQVGQDGKVSPAVPGIIQQPAESLQSLMTAPLSDIVRSGDRDAIRAASEASFDVASMLPAAGVAAGRTMPTNAAGMGGGRLDPPSPKPMSIAEEMRLVAKKAEEKAAQDAAAMTPEQKAELAAKKAAEEKATLERLSSMLSRPRTGMWSNPDDPNTAAILAALSGMDNPGRMTGEDVLKARTRQPANLNEPGLAQLEPGPQDTASFRGYQQGEVKPLYEYDPSKWDKTGSRERAPGQPPQDVAENLFPQLAAKAKDTWDVIDAAQPLLARMRETYGASVQQGISDLPKETAARMLQTVFDGVKGAGTPDAPETFVTQRYSIRLTPMAEKAAWMSDGSGTTLLVGTKATASDISSAIKSRIAKDGRWKPFDGVYANADDPTTAAILALLTQQQQGGQQQQ